VLNTADPDEREASIRALIDSTRAAAFRRRGDRTHLVGDRRDLHRVLGDGLADAGRVLTDVVGLAANRAREVGVFVADRPGKHVAQVRDVAMCDLDDPLDVASSREDVVLGGLVDLSHASEDALTHLAEPVEHGLGERRHEVTR